MFPKLNLIYYIFTSIQHLAVFINGVITCNDLVIFPFFLLLNLMCALHFIFIPQNSKLFENHKFEKYFIIISDIVLLFLFKSIFWIVLMYLLIGYLGLM